LEGNGPWHGWLVQPWLAGRAPDVANNVLFAGYPFNAETGLYLARNRMYHPTPAFR
jgi:hypothetical protein